MHRIENCEVPPCHYKPIYFFQRVSKSIVVINEIISLFSQKCHVEWKKKNLAYFQNIFKNMKQNGWQKTDLNTKNLNSHILYRQ